MAQTYLLAELEYLADELRNPLTALSRTELADLARRAWRDAASLSDDVRLSPHSPVRSPRPEGSNVVSLFGR